MSTHGERPELIGGALWGHLQETFLLCSPAPICLSKVRLSPAFLHANRPGMLYTFLTTAQLPYCRGVLNISGDRYQSFGTIALSPWSMKAFVGAVSDSVRKDCINLLTYSPVGAYFWLSQGIVHHYCCCCWWLRISIIGRRATQCYVCRVPVLHGTFRNYSGRSPLRGAALCYFLSAVTF